MPIIEIKRQQRPNTSVAFYPESGAAPMVTARAQMQPYFDSGALTSTPVLSDDGLIQTRTITYDSLETWNAIDNIIGIELDASFKQYEELNGFASADEMLDQKYELQGIDNRFSATVVYNFPATAQAHAVRDQLAMTLSNFNSRVLSDLVVTDTAITVKLEYNNSADYSENVVPDFEYVQDMHDAGFTRTVTYALL